MTLKRGAFMTTTQKPAIPSFRGTKRLSNGDRIFILTDTSSYSSAMYGRSAEQQWYRVGAVDLRTGHLGYFDFSTDDARQMVKSGLVPPRWAEHQKVGIELVRLSHGSQTQGRFKEKVTLIDLDHELLAQGPMLRRYFEQKIGFTGNSSPAGMWEAHVAWAARENAIEAAALSMVGSFSAGDVTRAAGLDKLGSITGLLSRLVAEGRLVSNEGRRRARRYEVACPKILERIDWTG
jgi:hypothetical protein